MEKWYIPLSILPGIGLIIMSTTNLYNSIVQELEQLFYEQHAKNEWLLRQKIIQQSLLIKSLVCNYICCAMMIITGLLQALGYYNKINFYILITGILLALAALVFLSSFSIRAVKIRKCQYKGETF